MHMLPVTSYQALLERLNMLLAENLGGNEADISLELAKFLDLRSSRLLIIAFYP